jgi:subtilisin family serine protease
MLLRLITLGVAGMMLTACAVQSINVPSNYSVNMRDSPQNYVLVTVNNTAHLPSARAGSTWRGYNAPAAYVASSAAKKAVLALAHDYHLVESAAWPIAALDVHCVVFRLPDDVARDELVVRLMHDPRVTLAQPLQTFASMSTPDAEHYNDPYLQLQSAFASMDVADAHRWSRGDGIRVAIIDTGIDTEHPDLKGRVVQSRNFVDSNSKQFAADRHGTEVAGIIAARANNGIGIVGVAPNVEVVALKACWQLRNDSAEARCNSFTLAQALSAAIDAKVRVINLSLSGPADPLLDALMTRGIRDGIIFTGAIGPDGAVSGFPVSTRGVIAVEDAQHPSGLANVLPAPGSEIITLTPAGHYDFASGPSLATAHVTGLIALLLAQEKHLGLDAIKLALQGSLVSVSLDGKQRSIVNACNALRSARPVDQCRDLQFKSAASSL